MNAIPKYEPDTVVEQTRAAMRQDYLSRSKYARQMAVAMYPLHVAQMAADLKQMLDLHRIGTVTDAMQEAIDEMEDRIRHEFREQFGCDIPLSR